ncbi:MAG TPA: hypothetical protein VKA89_07855 [Solirubrobacterales bacterium]|nr:hypothetical protein [Solirubrobacterales bacterium]
MSRPSPATVIATIALFVAMGGGAYAALKAPKNSVSSRSIKNGQVKRPDLGANAVNGRKVADGSVSSADIQDGGVEAGDLAPGAVESEAPRDVTPNPLTPTDPCDSGQTAVFCGYYTQEPDDGNWENVGGGVAPVRFYRDLSGTVHLEGVATINSYQTRLRAFILPTGYRPASTHLFGTQCWGTNLVDNGDCVLSVEPDGDVWWEVNQDNGMFPRSGMSFGGASFHAAG